MEKELFIHAQWNRYTETYDYALLQCDMTAYGYALIEQRIINFKTPTDKNLRLAIIAALQQQKLKKAGEAYAADLALQDEINNLLALEFKPAESA